MVKKTILWREMMYKTWKYRQKRGIIGGAESDGSFQRLMMPNRILGEDNLEKESRRWVKGEKTKYLLRS